MAKDLLENTPENMLIRQKVAEQFQKASKSKDKSKRKGSQLAAGDAKRARGGDDEVRAPRRRQARRRVTDDRLPRSRPRTMRTCQSACRSS